MTEPKTNQFITSEVNLVTYLNLRGIKPVRHERDNGRGVLFYERDADLEGAVFDFNNRCAVCGIAFSEVGTAMAQAKRMVIDGKLERR